ncbi:hypothetical protein OG306_12550 [Streptomyces sp. NBC_01241]|nr:hypothetical protein OG306_12550 [Streptomyces sp. NBC_01241]
MNQRDRDTEMARHLDRVCRKFSTKISPEAARRLARLLERQPGGKIE